MSQPSPAWPPTRASPTHIAPRPPILLQGGLDHEVLVWNPLSERVICNLRMHTAPITAIEAVHRTPMVVSADTTGVLCVWDCRSLSCSQKIIYQVRPMSACPCPHI